MFRILLITLLLVGCQSVNIPPEFSYKEIKVQNFNIASWQKITNPQGTYKIYLEGDGYAFNRHGQPTADPTPKGTLVRELAFGDKSPNVIYLARPCQYIDSHICTQKYWTTARFAPEVIKAEYDAVKQIAGAHPVILIGFSGGAQIAGLLSVTEPRLNIKKIITLAGNLDHSAWTQYHHLPPLAQSSNLKDYQQAFRQIPQIHYVGSKDRVIPPLLVKNFVGPNIHVITIEGATHNTGWESVYPAVRAEK